MSTQEQQEVSEGLLEISLPNWDHWRQRGHCMIWQAVMLTLNIHPSKPGLKALKEELYAEYLRRREILNVQYGVHPMLPKMDHRRSGDKESGQYVALTSVLDFAKDIGWIDMEHMEAGLSRNAVYSASGNWVQVEDDGLLAKGERYTLIRMGALLKILEKCLQPANAPTRAKLLNGSELNMSALGLEIEKEIADVAHLKNGKTVSRFKAGTNRKSLADAKAELAKSF